MIHNLAIMKIQSLVYFSRELVMICDLIFRQTLDLEYIYTSSQLTVRSSHYHVTILHIDIYRLRTFWTYRYP